MEIKIVPPRWAAEYLKLLERAVLEWGVTVDFDLVCNDIVDGMKMTVDGEEMEIPPAI